MSKLFSQQSCLGFAVGCLIVVAASDAWAQNARNGAGRQFGGAGQAGAGGMGQAGAGGIGQAGGGAAGGTNQPSGAVTGEISRSADRVLEDGGAQNGTARGGMPGAAQGGMGGFRGAGGMGGAGGFGGRNPFGASPFGANDAAATPSVRTRLRAAIQSPATAPQMIDSRAQRQIATTSTGISRRVNGFSVAVQDGVATVSGTASSARDRRMAELVLLLEPGVRQVNNQIVVTP